MRVHVLLLASLISLPLSGYGGKATAEQSSPVENPSLTERYVELLREGEKHLAAGELAAARSAFEGAAAEQLVEVPNYEVLVRIAEVRCREGDRKSGLSVLADFRCMLEVDAGRSPCFIEVEGEEPGRPNPELSVECFERMCSELYLLYYEHLTQARLKRIDELMRDADRVKGMCSETR
jgi:hypothetical protein